MTELERLAELLHKAELDMWGKTVGTPISRREFIADFLLDHGVIVPPCKVGDVVYRICGTKKCRFVAERIVVCIKIHENGFIVITDGAENILGTSVFLTREEAEAALAERRKA